MEEKKSRLPQKLSEAELDRITGGANDGCAFEVNCGVCDYSERFVASAYDQAYAAAYRHFVEYGHEAFIDLA